MRGWIMAAAAAGLVAGCAGTAEDAAEEMAAPTGPVVVLGAAPYVASEDRPGEPTLTGAVAASMPGSPDIDGRHTGSGGGYAIWCRNPAILATPPILANTELLDAGLVFARRGPNASERGLCEATGRGLEARRLARFADGVEAEGDGLWLAWDPAEDDPGAVAVREWMLANAAALVAGSEVLVPEG